MNSSPHPGSFWDRFQRILRLEREHADGLSAEGLWLLRRARVVAFSDWADVVRERVRA